MSNLTRAQREELGALSQEVFGASSRYKKLMDQGYDELVTEELDEIVPGENGAPDTTRQVKVPIKREDGAFQSVRKYHTAESVKTYMLERKEMIDQIKAQLKKQQEEAAAKKAVEAQAKLVHESLVGSAV